MTNIRQSPYSAPIFALATAAIIIFCSSTLSFSQPMLISAPETNQQSQVVKVLAGIDVWGLDLDPTCIGYYAVEPALEITNQNSKTLAIFAAAHFDTVLAVQTPDGTFICSDDEFNSSNSAIMIENAEKGQYRIWPGAFSDEKDLSVQLGIGNNFVVLDSTAPRSKFEEVFVANFDASKARNESSSKASKELMTQQLLTAQINSASTFSINENKPSAYGSAFVTGEKDFSNLNANCQGLGNISHPLTVTTEYQSDREFIIFASSATDLSLMVIAPDGRTRCADDFSSTPNPLVSFDTTQLGVYHVYLGSYSNAFGTEATLSAGPSPSAWSEETDQGYKDTYFAAFTNTNTSTTNAGSIMGEVGETAVPLAYLSPTSEKRRLFLGEENLHLNPSIMGLASLNALSADCVGYSSQAPTLTLAVNSEHAEKPFTISGETSQDSVMATMTPSGDILCSDDGPQSIAPLLIVKAAEIGTYKVWFGSYEKLSSFEADILIRKGLPPSAAPLNTETEAAVGIIPFSDAAKESINLPEDFNHDSTQAFLPYFIHGCTGGVNATPFADIDLSENLENGMSFSSNGNILIKTPNGDWICQESGQVRFDYAAKGMYRVWLEPNVSSLSVGANEQDTR